MADIPLGSREMPAVALPGLFAGHGHFPFNPYQVLVPPSSAQAS